MQFIDLDLQQQQLLSNGVSLREDINKRIAKVLDHGKYILGPEVEELEEKLSSFVGVNHCIGVSSGTDALLLALMALNINPGDEVITTAFSFIATAETIAILGAKPIFVDIDPVTYNLNARKIESSITSKTKAIIAVNLYGLPAEFDQINEIAKKYNLPVIEDGAQSFGAKYKEKNSCGLSLIGVTSFFPSKPLGCYGDGGACFTNDSNIADSIRKISRHGQKKRYYHTEIGINGRIDTIQACIILSKLNLFEEEVEKRNYVAKKYFSKFKILGFNNVPHIPSHMRSVFGQFTIEVSNRSFMQKTLNNLSIPTSVHYPLILPNQPCFNNSKLGAKSNIFPKAFKASQRVLSLPMHPYVSEEDQDTIVDAIVNAEIKNKKMLNNFSK